MSDLNRRAFISATVGTVVVPPLLVAACSSPTTQAKTTQAQPASTPPAPPQTTEVAQVQPHSGGQTHTVEIKQFKFVPDTLSVRVGDKIKWVNKDIVPHTATAADETWDTGALAKDESAVTVVSAETTEEYFCVFHPHMIATLKLVG